MADPLGDEFDAADAAAAGSATAQTPATDASAAVASNPTTQDSGLAASQNTNQPAASTAATPAAQTAGALPNQPATPAAPNYTGARDFVTKALGFAQAETYGDDAAFLTALVEGQKTATQRLQEMQQLAQFGQMYLNERSAAQRTAPAGAANAAPDPLAAYKAPEFNPSWQGLVERTETGGYKLRDGADPAILPKFLAYQQYRQETADKLLANPVEFLTPLVKHLAQEQAQQIVQTQFGQQETSQYVNGFMSQNAGWLFQADQAGNRINNPMTGQPILSPAGNRFYQHLRGAESLGITNPKAQENYARALLMADLNQPAKQAQTAVATGDAAKAAMLAKMNRNPNASGSFVGADQTGHTAPASQNESLSIHDRLRQALAGIPDADFNA